MDVRAFGVLDAVCGLVVIIWVAEFVTKFGALSVCVCVYVLVVLSCVVVEDSKLKPFVLPSKGKAGLGVTILNSSSSSFCDYKFGFCCAFGTRQPRSQSIQLGY